MQSIGTYTKLSRCFLSSFCELSRKATMSNMVVLSAAMADSGSDSAAMATAFAFLSGGHSSSDEGVGAGGGGRGSPEGEAVRVLSR